MLENMLIGFLNYEGYISAALAVLIVFYIIPKSTAEFVAWFVFIVIIATLPFILEQMLVPPGAYRLTDPKSGLYLLRPLFFSAALFSFVFGQRKSARYH